MHGRRLYGDDFSPVEIDQWFVDEADAYATIFIDRGTAFENGYIEAARYHGYRHLPVRRWSHVVGFGAADGGELAPIAKHTEKITIIESTSKYQTSKALAGTPVDFVAAEATGDIVLPNGSADLLICLGVLHHIPNVTKVISEFRRVLKNGGWAVIREPIIAMGSDWTVPRSGLTPHERGIPLDILKRALADAGFRIVHEGLQGFPPVSLVWRYWTEPWNSPFWVRVDAAICRVLRSQIRYRATSIMTKLRPTSTCLVVTTAASHSQRSS
jgi:SAM-dependent methyltransferase